MNMKAAIVLLLLFFMYCSCDDRKNEIEFKIHSPYNCSYFVQIKDKRVRAFSTENDKELSLSFDEYYLQSQHKLNYTLTQSTNDSILNIIDTMIKSDMDNDDIRGKDLYYYELFLNNKATYRTIYPNPFLIKLIQLTFNQIDTKKIQCCDFFPMLESAVVQDKL